MNRLGISWREWEEAAEVLGSLKRIGVEGLMSHFSAAEREAAEDRAFTQEQLSRFMGCVNLAREKGMNRVTSTWPIVQRRRSRNRPDSNLVRTGIMLYGYHPSRPCANWFP